MRRLHACCRPPAAARTPSRFPVQFLIRERCKCIFSAPAGTRSPPPPSHPLTRFACCSVATRAATRAPPWRWRRSLRWPTRPGRKCKLAPNLRNCAATTPKRARPETGRSRTAVNSQGDVHAALGCSAHTCASTTRTSTSAASRATSWASSTRATPTRCGPGARERSANPDDTAGTPDRRLGEAARHVRGERGRVHDGQPDIGRGDRARPRGSTGVRSGASSAARCAWTRCPTSSAAPKKPRSSRKENWSREAIDKLAKRGHRGHRQAVHRQAQKRSPTRRRPTRGYKTSSLSRRWRSASTSAVRRGRERAQPRRARAT